ncbi:hypothetical protein JTB14_034457 [Gonioctena quinquepunctata]|nr:hypothetical protein JTB14_034457 [Gonioctena quinquepunctata]
MTEAISHSSNTYVEIFTTSTRNRIQTKRKRPTFRVVISEENKSFSEVLDKIKNAIGENEVTSAIRIIRSTKDGKVLLTTDRDPVAPKVLSETLSKEDSLKMRQMKTASNTDVHHIRSTLTGTTKEDIDSAIKKATRKESTECKISDTRPLQNNTLSATLSLQKDIAELLLAKVYIQVVLVRCIVEKRHKVSSCTKCWSFDHTRESYNGPDRSTSCFKCGSAEHNASECDAEDYCPVCNEKRHHTGTMKCPVLKIALKKARLQSRPRYFSRGNRDEVELRKQ